MQIASFSMSYTASSRPLFQKLNLLDIYQIDDFLVDARSV